jgi:hypothetical protein
MRLLLDKRLRNQRLLIPTFFRSNLIVPVYRRYFKTFWWIFRFKLHYIPKVFTMWWCFLLTFPAWWGLVFYISWCLFWFLFYSLVHLYNLLNVDVIALTGRNRCFVALMSTRLGCLEFVMLLLLFLWSKCLDHKNFQRLWCLERDIWT